MKKKNIVEGRHYGRFEIQRSLIEKDPESVLAIMAHVVVIDITHDFMNDCILYNGFSSFFDPLPAMDYVAPEYVWLIEKDSSNRIDHIRVTKIG